MTAKQTVNEARRYLETIEGLVQRTMPEGVISPYSYILKHGREYGPRIHPAGIKKMPDKQCFKNAFHLAERKGFKYVEGIATSIIPTDHAWCVNDRGEVIDPTWRSDNKYRIPEYFGVEIPIETLHRIMLLNRVYGVFGNWQKWDEVLEIFNK